MTTKTINRTKRGVTWVERKHQILEFIKAYKAKYDLTPAMADIAEEVYGTRNAGNIQNLIDQLVDEGFLYKVTAGRQRKYLLTSPQPREKYIEE